MKDVIVIGGGLTGMLASRTLHDAGLKVMLIDQGELGHESSWASSGIISPLSPWQQNETSKRLMHRSTESYPAFSAELTQETHINPQLLNSGMLLLNQSLTEEIQHWSQQQNMRNEQLDSNDAIKQRESGLQTNADQALWLPDIYQIRSPSLVQAMAASLRRRHLLISEHQPVNALITEDQQVKGVVLAGETFLAEKVIVTAGAWSQQFPELQGILNDLTVLKEELILFRGQPGMLHHIVVDQGKYLVPRADGRIICGAVQTQGSLTQLNDNTTPAALAQLRDFAFQLLPVTKELPIRNHWCGLHALPAQGLPLVGEHPDIKGLYFNIGNGGHSLATGLASTEILTDNILGRQNPLGMRSCGINS